MMIMNKRLILITLGLVTVMSLTVVYGLPAFAQTHIAASLPGRLLSDLAAQEIIIHSGLPAEKLPGDITNELTRSRDAVNAYRDAHQKLSEKGWYRGIGEDHTPLLTAMVNEMEKQGYKSDKTIFQEKTAEVLEKFWYDSDTQNAKEIGFESIEDMNKSLSDMVKSGKQVDAERLGDELRDKWK